MTRDFDDTQDALSDVLRVLMATHKMSQADVGRAIGHGPNTVSLKLSGRRKWQLDDLDALAEHFGVRPADLIVDPVHALQAVRERLSVTRQYPSAIRRLALIADAA